MQNVCHMNLQTNINYAYIWGKHHQCNPLMGGEWWTTYLSPLPWKPCANKINMPEKHVFHGKSMHKCTWMLLTPPFSPPPLAIAMCTADQITEYPVCQLTGNNQRLGWKRVLALCQLPHKGTGYCCSQSPRGTGTSLRAPHKNSTSAVGEHKNGHYDQ